MALLTSVANVQCNKAGKKDSENKPLYVTFFLQNRSIAAASASKRCTLPFTKTKFGVSKYYSLRINQSGCKNQLAKKKQ
jgi:hypothetical protein